MKKINLIFPILGSIAAAGAGIAAVGCSCGSDSEGKITVTYEKEEEEKGSWADWVSTNPTQLAKGTNKIEVKINVKIVKKNTWVFASTNTTGVTITAWEVDASTIGEQTHEFSWTGEITSLKLRIGGE